jgi:hypothetical protein
MISGERFGAGFGIGASAMSASVIAATRTMSEIMVQPECGGYVGNDANDPQPTLQRPRE